jgi:hypothetical protein
VTSISDFSFECCDALTSVTVFNPIPIAIEEYVFTNRTNATLYVPWGSKSAYQAANYWKDFLLIEEKDFYIAGDVNDDSMVDIADAVCIVNHIVGKATPTFIEAAADVNNDGVIDIADAVRIVNLIVGKIDALAREHEVEWNLPEPE